MITKSTTLVLGAGASMDYQYPSGNDLTGRVIRITNETNTDAYRCLLSLNFKEGHISSFCNALKMSGRPSVDAFLEHRPEFVDIGKVAMTLVLVKLEVLPNLFKSTENWYTYLFNRMEAPFSTFADNKISFVTFNYDRSLEVYLFKALKNAYGKSNRDVSAVVSSIPIIHVHGKLGDLPWENSNGRKYEYTHDPDLILTSAHGIKIISESSKVDVEFGEAKEVLRKSDRLIFLGFGYHRANLLRLGIDNAQKKHIYGSCYNFTRRECSEIEYFFKPTNIILGSPGWRVLEFLREDVSL